MNKEWKEDDDTFGCTWVASGVTKYINSDEFWMKEYLDPLKEKYTNNTEISNKLYEHYTLIFKYYVLVTKMYMIFCLMKDSYVQKGLFDKTLDRALLYQIKANTAITEIVQLCRINTRIDFEDKVDSDPIKAWMDDAYWNSLEKYIVPLIEGAILYKYGEILCKYGESDFIPDLSDLQSYCLACVKGFLIWNDDNPYINIKDTVYAMFNNNDKARVSPFIENTAEMFENMREKWIKGIIMSALKYNTAQYCIHDIIEQGGNYTKDLEEDIIQYASRAKAVLKILQKSPFSNKYKDE